MTDKRMIVVESCYDCVRKGYRVGCPKNKHTFSGLPIPASCPLPKLPSVTRDQLRFRAHVIATDQNLGEMHVLSLLEDLMNQINVEIEDGD